MTVPGGAPGAVREDMAPALTALAEALAGRYAIGGRPPGTSWIPADMRQAARGLDLVAADIDALRAILAIPRAVIAIR